MKLHLVDLINSKLHFILKSISLNNLTMKSSATPLKTLIFLCSLFCAVHVYAQNNVRGLVKDEAGRPLIGASVQPRDSKNGTLTDEAGKYVLKLPAGSHTL